MYIKLIAEGVVYSKHLINGSYFMKKLLYTMFDYILIIEKKADDPLLQFHLWMYCIIHT